MPRAEVAAASYSNYRLSKVGTRSSSVVASGTIAISALRGCLRFYGAAFLRRATKAAAVAGAIARRVEWCGRSIFFPVRGAMATPRLTNFSISIFRPMRILARFY